MTVKWKFGKHDDVAIKTSWERYREKEMENEHLRRQLHEAASRFEDSAEVLETKEASTEHIANFFRASARRYFRESSSKVPVKLSKENEKEVAEIRKSVAHPRK